jgi:hypothetical protein
MIVAMTTMKLIVGLMLALVLVAPVLAWAECAWVLWVEWPGGYVQYPDQEGRTLRLRWTVVVSAYESRAECAHAQRIYRPPEGYSRTFCLPDTIDPRGPKAT